MTTMNRTTAVLAALAVAAGLSIATAPDAEAARWRFPVLSTHCGVEAAWALSGAVQNRHISVHVWERATAPGFSEVCVTARDLRRTTRPVVMVVRNLQPPAAFDTSIRGGNVARQVLTVRPGAIRSLYVWAHVRGLRPVEVSVPAGLR